MSTNELNAKVKELKQLKTMAKELEAEITTASGYYFVHKYTPLNGA